LPSQQLFPQQSFGLQHCLLPQFTLPFGQHIPFEQVSFLAQQSAPQTVSPLVSHVHPAPTAFCFGPQHFAVLVLKLTAQVSRGGQHLTIPAAPASHFTQLGRQHRPLRGFTQTLPSSQQVPPHLVRHGTHSPSTHSSSGETQQLSPHV